MSCRFASLTRFASSNRGFARRDDEVIYEEVLGMRFRGMRYEVGGMMNAE